MPLPQGHGCNLPREGRCRVQESQEVLSCQEVQNGICHQALCGRGEKLPPAPVHFVGGHCSSLHFVLKVAYETFNFLDKNRDTLADDLITVLNSSSLSLIKGLFASAVSCTDPFVFFCLRFVSTIRFLKRKAQVVRQNLQQLAPTSKCSWPSSWQHLVQQMPTTCGALSLIP